ncbi:ATP-binding cassette domain-containing protein [Paludibacteraceae bacterium OttesenSCG-928-F17]|nr:ATP-binding cassette domain-containing protein [Paludibacteraceae bacterium OttesenSCG-928-F17]
MSLQVANLTKKYGEQIVLNNISFNIGEGEVVGFLGPNGAGKTTTMKILTGSLPYETGSVKVCGLEVKDHTLETNALIGYLPEQNPLYTEMYVKEYLMFVAETYGLGKERKERVEELIEKVGLLPEYRKKVGQLSKGYRQRVGLAQALIGNPKVLILDEPTTGLDPNQLEEIRNLIREIGKDRTVLLSTHIMQEIKAICNRVVIINKGNIVADYPDLREMTAWEESGFGFEVEFLNRIDSAELGKINSVQTVNLIDEKYFKITANRDIRSDLFDFAVNSGNKILTMKSMEKSMEDIFRSLTR